MKNFATLMLFALLAFSFLAADKTADRLADFDFALDAKIDISNAKLNSSPQTILVKILANNPSNYSMPLFILRQDEQEGWQIVRILGGLAPKSEAEIELEVEVFYEKETYKKTRYAIVAKDEYEQTYGAYFEILEDWSGYEQKINEELSLAIVTIAPVITLVLIFLTIVVAQAQYAGKIRYEVTRNFDGYKMAMIKDETPRVGIDQRIAEVMMKPSIIGLELLCVALLVLIMFSFTANRLGLIPGAMVMFLSALGSFTIPFVYLLGAWYILKHEEGKHLKFFIAMFIWGMFVAFLSFMISTILISELGYLGIASVMLIGTILITPVIEEILKGVGVFFISGHKEFNDTLTGLLLGFTCGVGFAFLENWFYFSSKANPFDIGTGSWVIFILYRSFFNSLAHGCFTGIISATMGYVKGIKKLAKFSRLAFIPGLILAITIHAVFNISAIVDSFLLPSREAIFFVFNPMLIILLAAMFFLLLVLALVDEKKRKMQEEMGGVQKTAVQSG